MRVLVDGRVQALDGIGRYTRCVTAALSSLSPPETQIEVLEPTRTPRYTLEEGAELMHAAEAFRADIIHTLDFRIPTAGNTPAVVATVHDVLRLQLSACYTDQQFAERFSQTGLARLRGHLEQLRRDTDPPTGPDAQAMPLHAEFYARMLAFTLARSHRVIVPTSAVAHQVSEQFGSAGSMVVSPWGVDHDRYERTANISHEGALAGRLRLPGRFLLYVGQARKHKQLPTLAAAYLASGAPAAEVGLVCVGGDFAPDAPATLRLRVMLGPLAYSLGPVADEILGELYRRAEALIHIAEHEGFGFTPLEALARGTRVLAAQIPVLRETLGPHAMFVDPHSTHAIAAGIDRLLSENDTTHAREARIGWAERFNWERHAQDVLRIYTEVCA